MALSKTTNFLCTILYNFRPNQRGIKTEDERFAQRVAEDITHRLESSSGERCFFYDRDLLPGRNYFDTLDQIADNSKCFIVLMTRDFGRTTWSKFLERAVYMKLILEDQPERFIPVLMANGQECNAFISVEKVFFSDDWQQDTTAWNKLFRAISSNSTTREHYENRKNGMEKEDEQRFTNNIACLRKDLEPNDLLDLLLQRQIFSPDDVKAIKSKDTQIGRVDTFCDLILNSGHDAFSAVIEGLLCAGYSDLAEGILDTKFDTRDQTDICDGKHSSVPQDPSSLGVSPTAQKDCENGNAETGTEKMLMTSSSTDAKNFGQHLPTPANILSSGRSGVFGCPHELRNLDRNEEILKVPDTRIQTPESAPGDVPSTEKSLLALDDSRFDSGELFGSEKDAMTNDSLSERTVQNSACDEVDYRLPCLSADIGIVNNSGNDKSQTIRWSLEHHSASHDRNKLDSFGGTTTMALSVYTNRQSSCATDSFPLGGDVESGVKEPPDENTEETLSLMIREHYDSGSENPCCQLFTPPESLMPFRYGNKSIENAAPTHSLSDAYDSDYESGLPKMEHTEAVASFPNATQVSPKHVYVAKEDNENSTVEEREEEPQSVTNQSHVDIHTYPPILDTCNLCTAKTSQPKEMDKYNIHAASEKRDYSVSSNVENRNSIQTGSERADTSCGNSNSNVTEPTSSEGNILLKKTVRSGYACAPAVKPKTHSRSLQNMFFGAILKVLTKPEEPYMQ